MNKTLSYIASAVGGTLSKGANKDRIVNGFYSDSRTPAADKMFLAIRGERFDGNDFVKNLVSQGYAALTDAPKNLNLGGDVILVNNVTKALQDLACFYRDTELKSTPVVGITGSVGKTTTKDMVSKALSAGLKVYKTEGNFNSQIGLPQTVLAADSGYDCAVVELGMSYKGEMERISRCAKPNISIITNIGYSHIENLGSREAIRDEKLKIAAFSGNDSVLLLNGDEPLLRDINKDCYGTCYYVSASDTSCHCYATDICETENGISFVAVIFGNSISVNLNVIGRHYVINTLFALCASYLLGVNLNAAAESLASYKSDGKRQHIYQKNGHTVISDCYNASPESMLAALSVLNTAKNRRIAVLGDMLELGECSVSLHQKVGEYTNNTTDVLITYGDMAIQIANGSKVKEIYSFPQDQRQELLEFLNGFIKETDTVLYKASNGMKLSELIV
ncbi:MAG: UDP-N-acetylmuramoyl-tripeptide--D-alanyl-D-alanine ligase [Clostridia bacterium]|nr:UDP-N-acetylmuramoyl-tripeptide--D-alanyl-D-alanine ligase [Clostridia bacterium]